MPNLVGTGLNQVPTNGMLGGLAYQDPEHASIKDLDLKNLSQINSEIADTAVDVFVYDTRKDSDGGAWRKRTQHTSWYNETLNTSVRGSRKEFPSVAVIVLESTRVTIYDGDDPDLPMWMVFNRSASSGWTPNNTNILGVSYFTFTSISMLNGIFAMGADYASDNTNGVLIKVSFIEDTGYFHGVNSVNSSYPAGGFGRYRGSIAERDSGKGHVNINDTDKIANVHVNDVAMTVLPNAPIDDATELPVPTIAVAAGKVGVVNGGVSVIKDDGSVVDIGVTTGAGGYASYNVEFGSNNELIHTQAYDHYYASVNIFDTIPANDLGTTTTHASARSYPYVNSVPDIRGTSGIARPTLKYVSNSSGGDIAFGLQDTNPKLSLLSDNKEAGTDATKSMVAYITSDYNTGWMHGDIKGAFLSDTDATNVTGSEKIANYNFAADFSTQWEAKNNATTSYDATNDRVTVTSTQNYSGIRLKSASLPTLTNGKRYIMTVDIHSITNPIRFGVVSGGTKDNVNSTGPHQLMFTAGASITEVFVEKPTGSNSTFVLNSVSIRESEEDRSVNDKGLQVHGTITKSAVATGAELVKYGGFGSGVNANGLVQPYNTDMDWGTGDFHYMIWAYHRNVTSLYGIISRQTDGQSSGNRFQFQSDTDSKYDLYSGSNQTNMGVVKLNMWSHLAIVRSGSTVTFYQDGISVRSWTDFNNYTNSGANLRVGGLNLGGSILDNSYGASGVDFALFRTGASAPTAEQIKKIYEDEKVLFQENAKATLYGSSDAVTGLAHDDSTNLLYAGTSAGRSEFQGLRRINNTTTAVTTAISASNGLIAEQ